MPIFTPEQLHDTGTALFRAAGASAEEAELVVEPLGGKEAGLGTNPISVAFPSDLEGPIFLDMATSAVAAGKLAVQRSRHQPAPLGWVVDKDGNPTTDVEAYYAGGAILPMGGDQGHKGYVLSFMVETLSGILTGLGFGVSPTGRHNDGTFLAVFDVNAFLPLDKFKRDIAEFVDYLKATPPAAGFTEVLYPGELEYRTAQQRQRDGIYIEDETWNQITALQQEYGLPTSV